MPLSGPYHATAAQQLNKGVLFLVYLKEEVLLDTKQRLVVVVHLKEEL